MRNNAVIKAVYTGNGVTRRWSIPFDYFDVSEIHVLKTVIVADLEQETEVDTDSFAIDIESAEVIYPKSTSVDPVATGTKITIYRSTDTLQKADYTNQGAMWPETLESSLDKIHQVLQEHSEELARSFTVSMSSNKTPKEYADELIAGSIAAVEAASAAAQSATAAEAAEGRIADRWGLRKKSTQYPAKSIAYLTALPTGWYLECTTPGITDSGDITLPTPLVENATITDGTCVWKIRKISSADGMPIGAIIAYGGNGDIPSGYLLCDGAAYSRTAFPDLFAAIGTDYGSGDGSTTFNVPDSNQAKRFLQGDTVAGQTKSAGLPNITGSWGSPQFYTTPTPLTSGAVKRVVPATITGKGATSNADSIELGFDASLSNPIYGNSDTVQPPALTARYIIKAFDGQTADSALIDITQYENELGRKVDKSDMPFNGITNNSIYRGKDLTTYFESGQMSADMATGKWDNIFVGDYIIKSVTINGVTYADVKWIIMHINYHLHCGDTETTQNHVVLMPEEQLGTRQMNPTDTTAGGYVGSAMWTTHMPLVVAGIEAAFGADHVLAHRELLTNAMNGDLIPAGYTALRGATSGWAWVTAKANLATEEMVYGAPIWGSSAHDSSGDTMQLAAFKLNRGLINSKRYWWWLRSVARASHFCGAGVGGGAGHNAASFSGGGVRPYFLLH